MKIVNYLILILVFLLQHSTASAITWGYDHKNGPMHWSDLTRDFALCRFGKTQSPIDINTDLVKKAKLPAIKSRYKSSTGKLINTGHAIEISLPDGGFVTVPSGKYKFIQLHFHSPSEERINGKAFPLGAHLVHKNAAGNLAVIAILFTKGRDNSALDNIITSLPIHRNKQVPLKERFDVTKLLPSSLEYYAYQGSLTTPPCTEGVAWQVLKTPVEMSPKQIHAFKKIFKVNARPIQPLNGRKVQESSQ